MTQGWFTYPLCVAALAAANLATAGTAPPCAAMVGGESPATCTLPLKNGAFTETVNVGNSRAIVWSHMAHWRPSHPRHNLGGHHAGRWAAMLGATGHAFYQDVRIAPVPDERPATYVVRFAAAAFNGGTGSLAAFVQVHDASGGLVDSRAITVTPGGPAWQGHELRLPDVRAPASGATVRVAFKRADGRDGLLAVTDVELMQETTGQDR